jgi:hypothetical protein
MFLCRSWFIGITQTPTVLEDCRGFCIGILTETDFSQKSKSMIIN